MSKVGDWMKSVAFLAPAGHVGWGALFTLAAYTLGGLRGFWITAGVVFVAIAAKEYLVDPRVESNEDWKSGTIDLAGWVGGMGLTAAVIEIAMHLR